MTSNLTRRRTTVPLYNGEDTEQIGILRRAVLVAKKKAAESALEGRRFGESDGTEEIEAAETAYRELHETATVD